MKYRIQLLLSLLLLTGSVFAAPEGFSTIRFAAIGDYGSNSEGEKNVADLLKSKKPYFIITLGDNNYPRGCWSSIDRNIGQYYHQYIGNYIGKYGEGAAHNSFFPTLGNHDWRAKWLCLEFGSLPYLRYFSLPDNQRYYDFVKGPVHFFALDSDPHEPDGNTVDSAQYQWFESKIKASKSPFKIVYFHHPPYSSGEHGPYDNMNWPFAALGADVVLSGHEHNYERIERNGIVYIINGIGGPPSLRAPGKNPDEASKFFYSEHNGFMLITASSKRLNMKLINENDEVIDQYIIKK